MASKRKKKTRQRKKLLKQWSDEVRACGHCMICGRTDFLQAHHILPKEYYHEFQFVVINGVCLCPKCHKFGKWSAHKNPVWFTEWLRKNRPEQYQWVIDHMGTPPIEGGTTLNIPMPTSGV